MGKKKKKGSPLMEKCVGKTVAIHSVYEELFYALIIPKVEKSFSNHNGVVDFATLDSILLKPFLKVCYGRFNILFL